jgi:hypothetical protein
MPMSSRAPPASAGSNRRPDSSNGAGKQKLDCNPRSAPMALASPPASQPAMRPYSGRKRVHIASIRNTPRSRASATSGSAWARLGTSGFSHSTALPASSAARTAPPWRACGVAM